MTADPLQVYIDGEFHSEGEARISVFDHGLLYGDGVFEGIRFYCGRVFQLDEHIDRLFDSAKAIHLEIPGGRREMAETVLETIRRNGLRDGYVRLIVTRGVGGLGLSPYRCERPSVVVIASTISLYSAEKYEKGLVLATCSTRRPAHDTISPAVKSLNYLSNVMAKIEALASGAEEGVMLNAQGCVAECTGDNVFIVKDGEIATPTLASGLLYGITRRVVIDLARAEGLAVRELVLSRYDLYTADELFLTGTAAEVVPVVEYDKRVVGDGRPGPVTLRLMAAYRHLAETSGTPIY